MTLLRLCLVSLALTFSSLSASAQIATDDQGKTWTVNIRSADIQAFINQVADMTGKSFVVDPRIRARDVTVISSQPLSSDAVYELFLSVLQVHGYAAVTSGDVIKIVPNTTAKQSNLPLMREGEEQGAEMLITRVIIVQNTPVEELVPVLRPLVPQYGHLAAVGSADALIISDHADNIRRIEAIIAHLDQPDSDELEVLRLKHAFASDVIPLLETLMPKGRARRGQQAETPVVLVADDRTNRLIMRGDRVYRERLRALVAELDTPDGTASGVQVIRLSYGDAALMAELLKNFADGAPPSAGEESSSSRNADSKVSIQADESLNALVIRAEPMMMQELLTVINRLDVRREQILIEAAIVEVTGDLGSALGFQYVGGSNDTGVGAVNFTNAGLSINNILTALVSGNPAGASLADGLTAGFGERDRRGDLRWGALVQALTTSTDVNLLSTPSILTLDNEEASIIVGENVPFVTGQSTNTGAGVSNPFTTIQREDVGLTLRVTPHVAGRHTIRLNIEQENSAVKESAGDAVDIVTTTRKITSTVLADDGETIALGGLIKDDMRRVVRKVPLLGDIPLLGVLFRSTTTSREKSNLMVFLRPTILANNERLVSMTREKYMGITALQFQVNNAGQLERIVRDPLPADLEQVFEGRGSISDEFREAFDGAQRVQRERPRDEQSKDDEDDE